MQELMAWTYGDGLKLHAVQRAILFHHRLVAIHPFDDGNGRMARLLMNLLLMQAGYPPAVIRQEDRGEYYAALAQADDKHTLPLLDFVGETLVHSMEVYLKASRNESIDDPDDIDKEISLLERDLEGRTRRIDARLDTESRAHFEEHVFRPLWTSVRRSLSKFSRMFLSSRHGIVKRDQEYDGYSFRYQSETRSQFNDRVHDLVIDSDVGTVTIFAQLRDFRDLSNLFSMEVRVAMDFLDAYATISLWLSPADDLSGLELPVLVEPDHELEIRYRQGLSELAQREFCQDLEQGILGFIKGRDRGATVDRLEIDDDAFQSLRKEYRESRGGRGGLPEATLVKVRDGRTLELIVDDDTSMHRLNLGKDDFLKFLIRSQNLRFHPRLEASSENEGGNRY